MKSRFSFKTIAAKATLISMLVFIIMSGVIGVVFVTFNRIELFMSNVVHTDVPRIVNNAHSGRDLTRIFTGTSQLIAGFLEQKTLLASEGKKLVDGVRILAECHREAEFEQVLRRFGDDLQGTLDQAEHVADAYTIAISAADAADLCTQLLAYSGQGKIEEEAFSMSRLVSEMTRILKTSISKNCRLNLNLEEQLPLTVGDPSHMRQILMNFVINASEAIGGCNGTIHITTGTMHCPLEYFTDDFVVKPVNPGLYVMLEVSDNGPGMDKETLGRIFEPFYTTKFTGRGLGLSAVLGIVRAHGGGLVVYSEPGVRTTFKAFFPARHGRMEDRPDGIEESDAKRDQFVGRVLLIDDEEIVRNACSSQLELLGLKVLTARDGQEGVEIYRERQAAIDLVLLDLTMPKMGGKEAFRILRRMNPEVKVVMASGYAEEDVTPRFAGKNPADYLRKPYTLQQLSSVLSRLLPESC